MHYSSGTKRETPDERTAEGDCTAWYTMPPHDARMWAARRGGRVSENDGEREKERVERERWRWPDRERKQE